MARFFSLKKGGSGPPRDRLWRCTRRLQTLLHRVGTHVILEAVHNMVWSRLRYLSLMPWSMVWVSELVLAGKNAILIVLHFGVEVLSHSLNRYVLIHGFPGYDMNWEFLLVDSFEPSGFSIFKVDTVCLRFFTISLSIVSAALRVEFLLVLMNDGTFTNAILSSNGSFRGT